MINATGKNGVNHGVKETPSKEQRPCCSCSFLKIQTILIQQEVVDIHDQHTRLIVIRCRCIFGNDHSLEEISRQHQRSLFLLHFGLIGNRISRLDIIALGTLVADKINFQLFADVGAFLIGFILHDNTHIHIEAPHFQLVKNYILHAVSFFNLTEIQPGIAKSHIRKIVLYRCVNVFLPLHIISNCAVNQEGITKIINVPLDCGIADFLFLNRLKCSGQFLWISQRTDC